MHTICKLNVFLSSNVFTGSPTDQQIDGCAKLAPVVAMYAGRDDMLEIVEDVIRVTQNDDVPVCLGLATARYKHSQKFCRHLYDFVRN